MLLYDTLTSNSKMERTLNNMKIYFDPATSGLRSLDETVGRFHPKDIIIVTNFDQMIRTDFINHIALKNSVNLKIPVVIFSSEMSTEDASKKLLYGMGLCQITPKDTPLYIEEAAEFNVSELKERIIKLKELSQIEIVIINSIDYIYRFLPNENEQRAIKLYDFTKEMKALAEQLDIIIIMTASTVNDMKLSGEEIASARLADLIINIRTESIKYPDRLIITVKDNKIKKTTDITAQYYRQLGTFCDIDEDSDKEEEKDNE